jgi:hypothetical protein
MENYYVSYSLAREKRKIAQADALQYNLVVEAESGSSRRRGSELLVKLGALLIQTGETIKSHAERNQEDCLSVRRMQHL